MQIMWPGTFMTTYYVSPSNISIIYTIHHWETQLNVKCTKISSLIFD